MPGVIMATNETLEEYRDAIGTQDTHKRLKIAEDLSLFLQDESNNIIGSGADQLADGLVAWINSSNFKVSCQGLELMGLIAERMGQSFKPHIVGVLSSIIDRLGDSKQIVRDQALDLILKFMSPVSSPQYVFDLLGQSFNHKNWRVREVLMLCITKTINRFDASSIQISKITPNLVKLLSDPTGQVRDTAVNTILEIYRHVGERFKADLIKKYSSDSKLNNILSKFDQVQKSGNMVAMSQTDGAYVTPERKKSTKVSSVRRSTSFSAGDKKKNHVQLERGISSGGSGAVDETDFMTAWEEVQEAKIFSVRDFPHEIDKVNEVLSNPNNDWEKRVDSLRHLRSLIKISYQVDNFPRMMKDLEVALRVSVKDLRSSVVREACITLSYLSSIMENKFDYLAEVMLPALITLIHNSAKIMSTSGHAAVRLIIKHTASPRLIPIIVTNLLTSKSKDVRRRSAEYLGLLLEVWDTSVLKSHVALLEEAIRKGISDADSEARAAVRRAYWHFADHYKARADALMEQFDSSKQKLLQSDRNLINAGVTRPATTGGYVKVKSTPSKPSRTMSASDTKLSKKKPVRNGVMGPPAVPPMQRSASQLDYKRVMPGMSPRQKSCDDMKRHAIRSQVREGRSRYAQRSTTSQPSSRTGSPKRIMPTFTRERSEDYMKTYSPQKTRIPTPAKSASRPTSRSSSRHTSRDPSPVRSQMPGQYEMRIRNGSASTEPGVTEDALWDAMKRNKIHRRERHNSHGSVNGPGSDESDTSSILSHDSNNKKNISHNYSEILTLLQQDSTIQKRDGLHSLLTYLHGMHMLSTDEAIRIKETFNRYFAEPNSKIYSLFLDVLSEFIVQCKNDLQDWLFVLLTRLLTRISTDILPSTQTKIARVLDIVRDSYSYDHQFQIITKYITDNTQTPSLKMKVDLLQYLTGLVGHMDASDFTNTAPIRLAVSRVVTWISEPKSADVRKEASAVIVALFQLNTPEFTMMLSNVPNSIQEGATRAIKLHLKQDSAQSHTPTNESNYNRDTGYYSAATRREQHERPSFRSASATKRPSRNQYSKEESSPGSYNSPAPRVPSRNDSYDGPESGDLHSRIPIPHKLSFPRDSESTPTERPPSSTTTPFSYATHAVNEDSPMWLSSFGQPRYETTLVSPAGVSRVGDGAEQSDLEETDSSVALVNQISTVLSGPTNSGDSEDIKSALLELLKMIRSGNKDLIGSKLKSLLPVVLNLLKHREATIRCLAARSLREIASSQPDSYRRDIKSFILPLLETEADSQKEVSKTAEECCTIVSQTLPPGELLPVLAPLVGGALFPTNVSAIKMLNSVTEHCDSSSMHRHIEVIVVNLLKAYDHDESSARKAAVFCLVAVHNLAGADAVTPFFKDLAGSKMKLLNLYIRRSQSSSGV